MKIAPKILLPCLFCLAAMFSACTNNAADNSNAASPELSNSQTSSANKNVNQTKDNVEVLMTIINLPLEPEETVWRENVPNNPNSETPNSSANKKKLTAVLRFSAVDAEKTVLQAQSYQPPSSVQIQTEDWFPAELLAQSELSGDETLKGTSYAANDFIQTPFTVGQIIRIENSNYFILELASE